MKNFIEIPFADETLDIYYIRTSIFNAVKDFCGKGGGSLLDIGCGKMPYKEYILENSSVDKYIGLDIETALIYDRKVKADYTWDGITMPFEDNQFECAFGTEVLEHCPKPEIILKETFRVLKPGGIFFFTVPFLWPLHEVPHDEYRYTPWSLERHLKNAGFVSVEIKALGGWHAALAQMMGLWVRRSGISPAKSKKLSYLFKPLIRYLIKKDEPPLSFKKSSMITGLCGFAKKES